MKGNFNYEKDKKNSSAMHGSCTKYCYQIYKTRRSTCAESPCGSNRAFYCLLVLCCRESRSWCLLNKLTSQKQKGY